MTSADSTLASIEGALHDYATSKGAMRWVPERVICDGGRPLWPERWTVWRHGTYHCTVTTAPDPEALARFGQAVYAAITASAGPFVRAMGEIAKACLPATAAIADFAHAFDRSQRPRWHQRNCRQCNPAGNPPPFAGKYKPGPKAARMRRRMR